ncbi:MAG: hypothetical protein J4203_03100 [Candidatus Diapherotrites archaeon]|uniref:Uncharacterized protein n=1 Tax=Candidatus Iainarchaeum sp. TaxID=3101447 RepID=A0A8T4LHV5_9ARCH|nr:hypothetical protein [Candidatus Diapherotrites archaeon]
MGGRSWRMRLPRGVRPAIQPNSVFILHALDSSVRPNAALLRKWVAAGHVVPVERVDARGRRIHGQRRHFLVPIKVPEASRDRMGIVHTHSHSEASLGIAFGDGPNIATTTPATYTKKKFVGGRRQAVGHHFKPIEQGEWANTRNLTLNDGESPHRVLKGAGTKTVVATVPFELRPKENVGERRLWGGAQAGTTRTSVENARLLQRDWNEARRQRDPVVMEAVRAGLETPTLQPVAVFKPLQVPLAVTGQTGAHLRSGHVKIVKLSPTAANRVLDATIERRSIEERAQEARLARNFAGVPGMEVEEKVDPLPRSKRQLAAQRVFAYEVDHGMRVEGLQVFSPQEPVWQLLLAKSGFKVEGGIVTKECREVPLPKVRSKLLIDFIARMAATFSLVKRRGASLSSRNGSSFSPQNVSILGQPLDLDTGFLREKARGIDHLTDWRECLSTLAMFRDRLGIQLPRENLARFFLADLKGSFHPEEWSEKK